MSKKVWGNKHFLTGCRKLVVFLRSKQGTMLLLRITVWPIWPSTDTPRTVLANANSDGILVMCICWEWTEKDTFHVGHT